MPVQQRQVVHKLRDWMLSQENGILQISPLRLDAGRYQEASHVRMPVFRYYRRSSSPDTKAKAIEVAKQIVQQFENCTEGLATLCYPDGRSSKVHLFNNLAYRIENAGTTEAKCIFTCLEMNSSQSNDEGQYRLQYQKEGDFDVKSGCTENVLFLEERVLRKKDLQRLLGCSPD
ncbi:hypothetical protein DFH28DRAFT_930863 [Melampsora americana]|nr:hypothetical protein DFH28DRAFT_930863 [Melampsora americana]